MLHIDTIDSTVQQLYDSISSKHKHWFDAHGYIDPNSDSEPFTIHTCSLSHRFPDDSRRSILSSLLAQLGLSESNTMLSYTEIEGSLTDHTDRLTIGPIRTLILLSDITVSVSQDSIAHTYTRGDTLVLDTSRSHSSIITDGSSSQRWLIIEDLDSSCTSVAEHFLSECVYIPLALQ